MLDKDWWLLRRLLREGVERYGDDPRFAGNVAGLQAALASMTGLENNRAMCEEIDRDVSARLVSGDVPVQ
jgi:hypothetical protein